MGRKIKILQAIRQGKVGGGETHVLDLVNNLDDTKFESVILSFTDGPMVEKLRADGFKTYVVHTETPFNFKVWKEVAKIVEAEQISLIHAHGTRANSNTFSSAKRLKIPLIYTVHGWSFHPDQNPIVKFIREKSEGLLVKMANKTICVSQSNLNDGKKRFPMPNAQVIVNGINQVKFDPDSSYKDIRAEFKINNDQVIIGYVARITAQKEPLTFLRAIAALADMKEVKVLIVGDGDMKPEMLKLAEELQLGDKIIFEDFRSDIPAILNTVDIFCLPSLWEGLPIALLEAMAMRKAIVATAIDGTKDLVQDMENGLLVPTSNPEALSKALRKLVSDPSLRATLGTNAGETIKRNFDIGTMTDKVEKVYLDLLA